MNRHHIVYALAATALIMGVLHVLSIHYHLYWMFWWMDIVVHFLGGLVAGLCIVWAYLVVSGITYDMGSIGFFINIFLGVLIVGVGWEVFEVVAGLLLTDDPFPDTFYDIWATLAGGLSSYSGVRLYDRYR